MKKAGSAYEQVVAEIVKTMAPGANVQTGQWVIGPDGRRDLDVKIQGNIDGEQQFVLIECKDWKDAVGIAVVDALDSKRRDVGADYAVICTNSTFTADALRKAKRVGIGMISILKSGDPQIRAVIEEEIYTKELRIEKRPKLRFHFEDSPTREQVPPDFQYRDIKYDGLPFINWVFHKINGLLFPDAEEVHVKYSFSRPLMLEFPPVRLSVIAFEIDFWITPQWMSQVVSIDASSGIYDYIRHQTIMPGGQNEYMLKGVDPKKWRPIDFIPDIKPPTPGSCTVLLAKSNSIAYVEGVDAPKIDEFVSEEIVSINGKVVEKELKPPGPSPKSISGIERLVVPIQCERTRIGRNEPCHCGSGLKYKKCHGK